MAPDGAKRCIAPSDILNGWLECVQQYSEVSHVRLRQGGQKVNHPMRLKVAVGGSVVALVLGAIVPAQASTVTVEIPVSCNMYTTKSNFKSVYHTDNGNMWVKQNWSNPSSTTVVWAMSSSGNTLRSQTVSTGGTVTWTGVSASTYTFSAKRSTTKDCNGLLPGDGNYTWNATIGY